jgi:pseudouridine synthase
MTEGLLLLTNDGGLKRQLELPSTGVVRTYRARAFGQVTQQQLESLADGISIEGIHYGSINANLERRTGRNCWIEMSLTEGKNREVRRVLEHLGLQVSRLIRTAYGPLTVDGLEPGDADEVDRAELEAFRKTLKLGSSPANGGGGRSKRRPGTRRARPPIASARLCFRCWPAGSAASRSCGSLTCSLEAARSASRRCPVAPRTRPSSSAT